MIGYLLQSHDFGTAKPDRSGPPPTSALQDGARHHGLMKIAAGQVGVGQVAAMEDGLAQAGTCHSRPEKRGAQHAVGADPQRGQIGLFQAAIDQDGAGPAWPPEDPPPAGSPTSGPRRRAVWIASERLRDWLPAGGRAMRCLS
jgi:hypothetical protein